MAGDQQWVGGGDASVVQVRKGRGMQRGLIWVEVYLPFDAAAFAAFTALVLQLGSAVAAAAHDPDLAKRALTPIDAHGEAMLAEDVEALAHGYLADSRAMDVMHDQSARSSLTVVESFVNGPEVASPHFWPGAWVIVMRVDPGSPEWDAIDAGKLGAVSFQAKVVKVPIKAADPKPEPA